MATEKISLFDTDRDILIETYVSPADAQRAAIDTGFARELVDRFLNRGPTPSTSTQSTQFIINNENDDQEEAQDAEVSLYRWSPPCVLLLLEEYKAMEETMSSGKLSHKKIWERIAQQLRIKGHNVTGHQCNTKLRSLKKTYKSVKDHNNTSGNDRRSWQFFKIMDEIFAKKAWSEPVAVASSTGLLKKSLESTEESDSGHSSKTNKSRLTTLLGKRIKQKEEHEENKKKRHNARMEMDEKFLKVLEKLADK